MGTVVVPPRQRLAATRQALQQLGFPKFLQPCRYLDESGLLQTVELAAFCDEWNADVETAAVAVVVMDNGHVPGRVAPLAPLGAPFAITAGSAEAHLWSVAEDPKPLAQAPYSQLQERLSTFSRQLNPNAIRQAKHSAIQLPLWAGVPEFYRHAASVTEKSLVDKFHDAVSGECAALDETLTRWAIDAGVLLLGAMMLEDKDRLPGPPSGSAADLLSKATKGYPSLFSRYEPSDERGPVVDLLLGFLEGVFTRLREYVTLSGMTFPMLRGLYEKAFLSREAREKIGITGTPLALARRIMQAIPLSDIAPDRRTVLDPCCGAGSLLYSALEQLAATAHGQRETTPSLREQAASIHGADSDRFSTFLSAVGLLSFAPCELRDVHVYPRDTLDPGYSPPLAPMIVAAHPPRAHVGRFVQKSVDWCEESGYIALVLPFGFMSSSRKAHLEARERLYSACELLDVWDLPPDPELRLKAGAEVVVARKVPPERRSACSAARVAHVTGDPGSAKRFTERELCSLAAAVPREPTRRSPDLHDAPSALDSLWACLSEEPVLSTVANARNALKSGAGRESAFAMVPDPSSQDYPFLVAQSVLLHRIDWASQKTRKYIDIAADLDRQREELFPYLVQNHIPKVIVRAKTPRHQPWRLSVAVDRDGCFVPSNSLHVVWPKEGCEQKYPAEVIAGILSSRLANAWVYCRNKTEQVNTEILDALPLPRLALRERRRLGDLVCRLTDASNAATVDMDLVQSLLQQVDQLVVRGYRLGRRHRDMLSSLFDTIPRSGPTREPIPPPRAWRPTEPPKPEDVWVTFGEVLRVNTTRNEIALWLADAPDDEDVQMQVPATFPGWALEPGARFEAEVLADWLSGESATPTILTVRPVGYSYLSDGDVVARLRERKS